MDLSMRKINRFKYLEKIRPFIGKPVIKILVGMRRVGKSELLTQVKNLIHQHEPELPCLYINKELRSFDFIKDNEDLNAYIDAQGTGVCGALFIDEVQEIENWEKSIASCLVEGLDIYITGSNAHLLSSDLATLLSGRYVEFPVYPLSFTEFSELRNSDETASEKFQLFLKYGGLPGLHAFEFEDTPSFQYLDAIYQSILLKDIVKRHQIRNVALLDNVTQYLFDNIGNLFNASNVSKYLRSQRLNNSLPTVQAQVKYICEAFLAHQVRQYDLKGKRYLEINDKYFVSDLGLRHAILGYKSADISGMLENIVFLELVRNDYQVAIGRVGKQEVDFVCDRRGERTYIQVSYLMSGMDTAEREFGALETIPDNHPKYVISLDPILFKRESGVKHLNLMRFLENGLP
jgi:predicted AAA+ superfamily ATPase